MEPFVRNFIRSSLVWLGIGVVLGLAIVFVPGRALPYRPAHMHANLLGFVSMMIFGVAYHVIPRFAGTPLRSGALAQAHLVLANAGLALMVTGWILRVSWASTGMAALAVGAVANAAGAFVFIANIWRTLEQSAAPIRLGQSPAVPVRTGRS